ncbi:alpha/beta hydrolase [Micromonospora sp. NPDC085948]|uniref:alpha/beta fold hydrolase n=1 Tax=Micromonospora sp. NPDC085948 TaxID=3155293 RepID=UPI003414BF84
MSIALSTVKAGLRVASVVVPGLAGKWTFALFCKLRTPSRVRPNEAEVHAQAQVDSIEYNGRRVVTYQWGDGAKPILVVHGWESRGSRYAPLVAELLARGYSAVTFDAPGNGDSEGNRTTLLEYADIVEKLYERHGPFQAAVAHSFGSLALFQAMRKGVKVDRVVTVNAVCDFDYLVHRFSEELGLSERLRKDLSRRFEGLFPQEQDIYRRFSVPYQADRVTGPVLVIHDEDDLRIEMSQAKKIAAAFPDQSRMITTQGFGHSKILTDPRTLTAIADFVSESTV